MDNGPWHLVHQDGRHHGPFTTELDAMMAQQVAAHGWQFARRLDSAAFATHLAAKV